MNLFDPTTWFAKTVFGVDVFGGNWDKRSLIPAGTSFLVAKCSEGTYDIDSGFAQWVQFAEGKDWPVSAYHYGKVGDAAEVAFALHASQLCHRLWLDVDDNAGVPTMPLAGVLPFLRIARKAGKDVGLYIDENVLDQLLATLSPGERQELGTYPLWIAAYHSGSDPNLSKAADAVWRGTWRMWQFSDGGSSGIDLDRSTSDEIARWKGSWSTPAKLGVAAGVVTAAAALSEWVF